MLAGKLGAAKNIFQIKSAAMRIPAISKIIVTRDRGALFSAVTVAPSAGAAGARWSAPGGG